MLNLDLQNFFPSINFGRVRGFFIKNNAYNLQPSIATIIAQIACHGGRLPQGSPCSPIISNLIGNILDARLVGLAKKYSCHYSRYADDLTFSTNQKKFPDALACHGVLSKHSWSLGKKLERAIIGSGFLINKQKTRVQYKTSRQDVTGLVVNQKINVKSEYYRRVRAMCHALFMTGEFTLRSTSPKSKTSIKFSRRYVWGRLFILLIDWARNMMSNRVRNLVDISMAWPQGSLNQLGGMLGYIYYIRRPKLPKDASELEKEEWRAYLKNLKQHPCGISKLYFRFLYYKYFFALEKPLIICEGKTDSVYLKCAIRRLPYYQEKMLSLISGRPQYTVQFFNYSDISKDILRLGGGAGELISLVAHYKTNSAHYKHSGQKSPVIIILDNDGEGRNVIPIIKKYYGIEYSEREKFCHVA